MPERAEVLEGGCQCGGIRYRVEGEPIALVACHCTVTATHTGHYMGLETTGKKVVLHEMMFNRVRDGRLAVTWAITSGTGFYEQLTGEPAPEQLDNMG